MQPRSFGELSIEIRHENDGPVRLDWRGKSNHRDPDAHLVPFFGEITNLALTHAAPIEMHFEALDFFNSSTITSIIRFVRELRDRKVPLTVCFNPHHKWQKIFFDALW